MEFCILTKDEVYKFIESQPINFFTQNPFMEESYKEKYCDILYVGVKKNKKVVASATLLGTKGRFGIFYYSPRGLILDYNNKGLLSFFVRELKSFIKSRGGCELLINPRIERLERDIDGNIVENGYNNENIVRNLKDVGFKHLGYKINKETSNEMRFTFELDLRNKAIEEISNSFKANHRNIIRKQDMYGIDIKEVDYDHLNDFESILNSTGERKGFLVKSHKYFDTLYKSLVPNNRAKFIVAYLDKNKLLKNLNDELVVAKEKFDRLYSKDPDSGACKEAKVTVDSLSKKIEDAKLLEKDYFPVSSALFIIDDKEIVNLFGGNLDEYMNYNAQYFIQWYIIKFAKENEYDNYNFYGISGDFSKNNPKYGMFLFKKGFGGCVHEFIGDFTLPITFIRKIIFIIKKILKR